VCNFQALRIHHTTVRDELIDQVGRRGVPTHCDKKNKGVVDGTEESLSAAFEDGETVKVDFGFGADGIHSRKWT